MNVEDKHVVITGGGTGAGAAIAQAFFRAGARVTIMGRSVTSLRQQDLPYQVCDVTDRTAVNQALDAARESRGPVQIMIANAGVVESTPFSRLTREQLDTMLAVNIIGVVNVWQAALADMQSAGYGRMIAIASTAGLKGYPYVAAYCAAKHGVVGLTRALAQELAGTGITVNAICPGFIETPMLERSVDNIVSRTGMSAEQARDRLASVNPQKRFIQTDEVAGAALWLCSKEARSVNGHTLSLSGGEI